MSSVSGLTNSFMKKEDSNPNVEFSDAKVKSNRISSCGEIEKATLKEPRKRGLRSSIYDMSQTLCLFKKYLLTRAQNNINIRTNTQESDILKMCPPHALPLPTPECESGFHFQTQAISSLEQKLLPQMRCDGVASLSEDRSSTPQLTIFYGGAINVYDNIPVDKAQAIILLASESSLSITGTEIPKIDTEAPFSHRSNVTPINKPKTDVPMARRYSLQCFLKKRRNRIVQKSPYASGCDRTSSTSISRNMADMRVNDHAPCPNHIVSLSPFPSRLGFCSSITSQATRP